MTGARRDRRAGGGDPYQPVLDRAAEVHERDRVRAGPARRDRQGAGRGRPAGSGPGAGPLHPGQPRALPQELPELRADRAGRAQRNHRRAQRPAEARPPLLGAEGDREPPRGIQLLRRLPGAARRRGRAGEGGARLARPARAGGTGRAGDRGRSAGRDRQAEGGAAEGHGRHDQLADRPAVPADLGGQARRRAGRPRPRALSEVGQSRVGGFGDWRVPADPDYEALGPGCAKRSFRDPCPFASFLDRKGWRLPTSCSGRNIWWTTTPQAGKQAGFIWADVPPMSGQTAHNPGTACVFQIRGVGAGESCWM